MHNIQIAGLINQAPTIKDNVEIATLPSVARNDNLLHEIANLFPAKRRNLLRSSQ